MLIVGTASWSPGVTKPARSGLGERARTGAGLSVKDERAANSIISSRVFWPSSSSLQTPSVLALRSFAFFSAALSLRSKLTDMFSLSSSARRIADSSSALAFGSVGPCDETETIEEVLEFREEALRIGGLACACAWESIEAAR